MPDTYTIACFGSLAAYYGLEFLNIKRLERATNKIYETYPENPANVDLLSATEKLDQMLFLTPLTSLCRFTERIKLSRHHKSLLKNNLENSLVE